MKDETHDLAIITIVIIIFYMKIYIPENTTYFTKNSLLLIVKFNEEKAYLKLVKLDEIPMSFISLSIIYLNVFFFFLSFVFCILCYDACLLSD